MSSFKTAYIGIGSNLADRKANIDKALNLLAKNDGVKVTRVSETQETRALGGDEQPTYLNAVAQVETGLSAEQLHKKMAGIEDALGRVRRTRWAPRTIDLDLLLYENQIINRANLKVPHEQMHLRSFVLEPLANLNGELVHPVIKKPVKELASRLGGRNYTIRADISQLVCIAGIIGVGKTTLTEKLSRTMRAGAVYEDYGRNPFMAEVYAGAKELALDSQLYFLVSRVEQIGNEVLEPGRTYITDYVFEKEQIYANQTLSNTQFSLYDKIHVHLAGRVCEPVLVIYLMDSVENCLNRIKKRNRPYEQEITEQFLSDLNKRYEQLFAGWSKSPVIRLSLSNFDCTSDADTGDLSEQIGFYIAG